MCVEGRKQAAEPSPRQCKVWQDARVCVDVGAGLGMCHNVSLSSASPHPAAISTPLPSQTDRATRPIALSPVHPTLSLDLRNWFSELRRPNCALSASTCD